jgi:hypothetical protein
MLKDILKAKFDLGNIKKIYLVPSKNIDPTKINHINKTYSCGADSLVVRFNKCDYNNRLVFPNITHLRFIRGFGIHIQKNKKLIGDTDKNALYFTCNPDLEVLNKIKQVNGLANVYTFGQCGIDNNYSTIFKKFSLDYKIKTFYFSHRNKVIDKVPSIGFIALMYLLEIFPDAVFYLVDFTFEAWTGHDMSIEKKICDEILKNKVIII